MLEHVQIKSIKKDRENSASGLVELNQVDAVCAEDQSRRWRSRMRTSLAGLFRFRVDAAAAGAAVSLGDLKYMSPPPSVLPRLRPLLSA